MKYEDFKNLSNNEIYYKFMDDPETFEEEIKELFFDVVKNYSTKISTEDAAKFKWSLDGQLRKIKDPTVRFMTTVQLLTDFINKYN